MIPFSETPETPDTYPISFAPGAISGRREPPLRLGNGPGRRPWYLRKADAPKMIGIEGINRLLSDPVHGIMVVEDCDMTPKDPVLTRSWYDRLKGYFDGSDISYDG